MMSLSRDSPGRQGDIRDFELGVVEGRLGEGEPAAGHERRGGGHAHEPRHAVDAGTDASLESGVPGVAVPEGCERGRPGLERVHFGERRPLEPQLPPEEHRVLGPKVHTLPSPELEADAHRPARAELQAVPRLAGIVGDEVGIPERSAPEPVADLCVEALREGHGAPAHEAARVLQRPQVPARRCLGDHGRPRGSTAGGWPRPAHGRTLRQPTHLLAWPRTCAVRCQIAYLSAEASGDLRLSRRRSGEARGLGRSMEKKFSSDELPLAELLSRAERGELQLPDFQRGWVWDDDHIRSLLVSISLSYPIGAVMTLVAGNPDVNFKARLLEGVTRAATPVPEILLLDGQQRLTSLFQALESREPVRTRDSRGNELLRHYYASIGACIDPSVDREEDGIVAVPADRILRSDFGRAIDLDLSREQRT